MSNSEFDSVNPRRKSRHQIQHELDKLDQIITALARVETKLDTVTNTVNQHDEVIDGLQKKWWSGVGAFFLAIGLWLKQLVG
jgi:hypothetical protein